MRAARKGTPAGGGATPPENTQTARTTLSAIARALGKTPQCVGRWARMPDFPPEQSIAAVRAWADARGWLRAVDVARIAATEDTEAAKARKLRAQADMAELEVARRRGELIPTDEVRRHFAGALARALDLQRRTMLDELPPLLVGKTAPEIRAAHEAALGRVWALVRNLPETEREP